MWLIHVKNFNYFFVLFSKVVSAEGYDVFAIGYYDIQFDATETNKICNNCKDAIDYRYERRFDKSLLQIGPENYDFFDVKPFVGLEVTSDSATYFLAGIYLDDNAGILFTGTSSNFLVTPSFGVGVYDNGNGKKLGNTVEFRTTIEVSYQFKNKNRIGLSLGHISNANLGDKNPGVEILSLSYQVPY